MAMKKIIFGFIFISTHLFSAVLGSSLAIPNINFEGKCYEFFTNWNYIGNCSYSAETIYGTISSPILCGSRGYAYTGTAVERPCVPTCTENEHLENNICVPNAPTCPDGSSNFTELEGSPCFNDTEHAISYFPDGNMIVEWADGALTWCEAKTGLCTTANKNAERIPNRLINPLTYADGAWDTNDWRGVVPPEAPPMPSMLDLALDSILQATGNAVGKTLQAFGMGIIVTGTGDGVLMYDGYQGLNLLNPLVAIGGAIFTLGNALVTPDNVIVTTPTPDESALMNLNIIERTSDSTLNTIENATPSDGTPAMTPNGAYTQKQVTEANLKTIWDNAGGVGKLPPNALVLGSDIIHPTNNPSTAIINSPDTIKFVETKPDNTSTVIEVAKTALAQTATNNTDLTYTKTDYQPPTINNDGTTSQGATTSTGTVASTTNNNTLTSSTGTTTVQNPTTGTSTTAFTTSSTGTTGTIDLFGVTSGLDKISNQMTKLNEGLEGGELTTNEHTIPTDLSGGSWNTYSETWNNLVSSFDSVGNKVGEVQSLFENGFTLNLTGGTVQTCPHTFNLNITGSETQVSIDFCNVLSPFRPVIYTFFYLFFVASIIMFSFKIMIRMA